MEHLLRGRSLYGGRHLHRHTGLWELRDSGTYAHLRRELRVGILRRMGHLRWRRRVRIGRGGQRQSDLWGLRHKYSRTDLYRQLHLAGLGTLGQLWR